MLSYIRFLIDIAIVREPAKNWLHNVTAWIRATNPSDVKGYQWGDYLNW